jgi:phosphoribosylaminoimidazole-succinocarboxamide synthase
MKYIPRIHHAIFMQMDLKKDNKKMRKQKQLSKEFVREWLIENEFMGKEGQVVPEMPEEWVNIISSRYIELYEKITGINFEPQNLSKEEIENRVIASLKQLS